MLWELIGTVAEGVNIDMMVGGLLSMVKTFAISFVFAQIVRGRRQLTSLYTASMIVPLLLLLMFRDDISRLMGELERGTQSDSLRIGGEALQGFGNANEVALFAVYSLIAAVGMFLMWKRSPLRWLALATAAPTLLFISYTGTRAGMITTAVLTVAFWFFYLRDIARDRPGLKVVGLLIMGLMLVGVGIWIVTSPFYYRFLQPTGNYYEGRGWLAVVGLRMFAASPIIGHGYYGFLTLAGKYGGGRLGVAHNTYVEMLIRGGLPGFLLYYSVWFVLIRQLWRLRKFPLSPGDRVAVNMSLLFCVAFNVMALSGSLINPRVVWMTVGACIGHTYALSDRIAAAEAIEGPQTEQLGEPLQARYGYS
jgi:O-antigen ligase